MPLRRGTSRATVSGNIHEMVAAGHPVRQAVAAALHERDESAQRKGKQVDGIRQHKDMAMGKAIDGQGSSFGVESLGGVNGGREHPDAGMSHAPMPDHKRGIGRHVARGAGEMPAQRSPDHGPHQMGGLPR